MNEISIHMFNSLGLEYASKKVPIPEGIIRWDDEFIKIVNNNLPAKAEKGSTIVIMDEEDNTVRFATCFNPRKTATLFR